MLINIIAGAILLGFCALWAWFLMLPIGRRSALLESRSRIQSPLGMVDVGMMFLLWACGMGAAINLVSTGQGIGPTATAAAGAAQLLMTFLAIGIFAFRYGPALRIIGFGSGQTARDLLTGVIVFVMTIPVILLVQSLLTLLIPYEHETLNLLQDQSNYFGIGAAWFSAVLAAPICEEIFFRGVLQGWLQRIDLKAWFSPPDRSLLLDKSRPFPAAQFEIIGGGYVQFEGEPAIEDKKVNPTEPVQPDTDDNPYQTNSLATRYVPKLVTRDSVHTWMPILLSSFFFAGMHIGQGPAPIPLFMLGIVLGYLYHRTHSIVACITVHMLLNALSMLMFTLQTVNESGIDEAFR